MQYGRLGQTDLEVSRVGFGTGSLGEMYGPLDEASAIRLVHEVIDQGINFIDTSRYYYSAEERLGKALTPSTRQSVILATKAGRYGFDDFDFTRAGIRRGIEESLALLKTDYVDVLLMHDIEFADLRTVFEDGYGELLRIRDEGKCRYVGVSGGAMATMKRAMLELEIDVLLTYAKGSLLDDSIRTVLGPIADEREVGLINAAAVVLGLLTPGRLAIQIEHPAPLEVQRAAERMRALCAERGVDIAFVANQYALQRSGCVTTVVGVGRSSTLRSAVEAERTPIDEELIADVLALRPPIADRIWRVGRPENN